MDGEQEQKYAGGEGMSGWSQFYYALGGVAIGAAVALIYIFFGPGNQM